MKLKSLVLLALAVFSLNPAARSETLDPTALINDAKVHAALATVSPYDLINWKVGDSMNLDVTLGAFGKLGKMEKAVTKDEGTALWITQNLNIQIQNTKSEMLINKADGKVLKLIVNGQEQQIPDEKIEIISQDYTEITVPAGTFKAIHIVAKTKSVPKIEMWANPKDVCMDGGIKMITQQMGMDITMELTSFKRAE